ncbi:MAG: hypothetical protein P1P74_09685 [Desulfuromonadales bacterium]|nr:hypothetical protein [Desulfuromonadales bacterium]
MKTRKHNPIFGFGRALLSAVSLVALVALSIPQTAQASTAAGTAITSTVIVDYKTLGGIALTATSTVTVTVTLVKAAPTLAFVSQSPMATVGTPTDESTVVTQTYSIYSNSNGSVEHTINQATYTPTNIDPATAVSAASTLWLGATTVAFPAANGATDIYVPFDGTADGEIFTNGVSTAGQGIVAGDFVMINGTKYTVGSITEDTSADAALPVAFRGDFAKITLSAVLAAAATPGFLVTEYKEFNVSLQTAALTGLNTTGSYAGSITASDGTNVTAAVATSVNVARSVLSVTKEVSVDGGANYLPTSATAGPGTVLKYRITVTNTGSKTASAITITDVLSPFAAFQSTAPTFTDDVTNSSGLVTTTNYAVTYSDQDNAAYTPLVDGGGGAPVGYDANVAEFKIDFTGQNMAANGKFTITYDVKIY